MQFLDKRDRFLIPTTVFFP